MCLAQVLYPLSFKDGSFRWTLYTDKQFDRWRLGRGGDGGMEGGSGKGKKKGGAQGGGIC